MFRVIISVLGTTHYLSAEFKHITSSLLWLLLRWCEPLCSCPCVIYQSVLLSFPLQLHFFIHCQANLVQREGSSRWWNSNKFQENCMFLCKKRETEITPRKNSQLKATFQPELWQTEAAKGQQKDGYWEEKFPETLPQEIFSAYCTLPQNQIHRELGISSSTHKARSCAS